MEKGSREWGSIGAAMLLAVFATAPYVLLLRALTGQRGWYLLLVSAVALSMFLAHRRSRQRIWREFTLRFDPTGVWRRRIVYRCALRSPFDDVEPHLASPELTASWFPQHRLQVQGRSPQLIIAPTVRASSLRGASLPESPGPLHACPLVWSWTDGTTTSSIGLQATTDGTYVVVQLEADYDPSGRRALRQLHPIVQQGLHHLHAELGR